jgi:ankyrin repeat protein
LEVIKYLEGKGAKMDAVDGDSWTALHIAALGGHLEVIKYLEGKGAEMDAVDWYGRTALDMAKGQGHKDVVAYLEQRAATSTAAVGIDRVGGIGSRRCGGGGRWSCACVYAYVYACGGKKAGR